MRCKSELFVPIGATAGGLLGYALFVALALGLFAEWHLEVSAANVSRATSCRIFPGSRGSPCWCSPPARRLASMSPSVADRR